MNSIATRTRTDPGAPKAGAAELRVTIRRVALLIATLILGVVLISFRPFMPLGAGEDATGGDIINQLGFGVVGALSIVSLAMLADPRKVARIVSPGWLLMFGFLFASVFASPDPATAIRGVMLTMVGVLAIVAVLGLPQDAEGYSSMLATVATIVIVVSYMGVVLLPDLATHGADAVEPQNSYLWRGVFTHKNIAGPVMAAFAFAGVYLYRRGWRAFGFFIGVSALLFVAQTGSKTTVALVPFAMLLVIVPTIFGLRVLTPIMMLAIQFLFAFLTFGTVLFEPVHRFVTGLGIDATFTGRRSIWLFALDALNTTPLRGFGYESFWSTPAAKMAANPYYLDWDVRGIVHSHNGYLDIALSMGIPALIWAIVVIVVMPMVNYMRCRPERENLLLADFFLMITFFGTLNAMLESFFFRRMDPVWLVLVFAIFGLQMTARVTIPTRSLSAR